MHIILNGNFWAQPNVGSGQYLSGLLRWFPTLAPQHRYTLLLPAAQGMGSPPPPGVRVLALRTPFDNRSRNLAKLWFEQVSVPTTAHLLRSHRREPTLVHVPYFAPPVRTTIVPLVTTIPDIIPLVLPAYRGGVHVQLYMQLVRLASRRADHTLTFSEYSRQDIVRHLGLPAARVSAILLAADERYQPEATPGSAAAEVAARYGLPGPFVYYVGGLDARKNVAVLIRAMALLRDQGRLPGTLAIAGKALGQDTRLFPDLDRLIAELDVADHVRRIVVPYEDGPLLYQACTAFAFPSTYEGFGLPPLEAMACGAPVVTSSTSSLPEVTADTALSVAPDDVAGWADAIARLLTDADLRATLRARGFERAAQFSWRQVAAETLACYEELA